MEVYNFKGEVDEEKVFVVKNSDLINRIDPYFYKNEFKNLRDNLKSRNFIRLGTLIKSWNRGDGPREGFYTNDSVNGVAFLRVNNLKNNSITLKSVKYINRKIHNTKLKRTQVSQGDLVFAISGTKENLGTVSIIPRGIKEANLNSALVRLDLDLSKMTNEFFCVLFDLQFIRTQIVYTGQGAAQNNLNNEEISSLLVPSLLLEIQQKIVDQYQKAYNAKEQKEKEAKDLLESIDSYLLDALGITLPKKDYSLESRIFTVDFSEVSGNRFEGQYYTQYNRKLIKSLENSTYKTIPIKKQCEFISGYAFSSNDYVDKSNCVLITIKNISKNTVNTENTTYLPLKHFDVYSRFRVHKNDLLIAMTGATIGKVGIYESDINALLNQRNGIIKSTKLNTYYLMNLLNTDAYQSIILKNSVGGAQPNISETDITRIKVPVPPLEKQNEIANYISKIRAKAKQLQAEAKAGLEQAKIEIEQLILGQ